MNRAACVSAEGELPKWVQRWLSWWKGQKEHNGAPVQVKFPPLAEPQLECLKQENPILNLCIFSFFLYYCSLVVKRAEERRRDMSLVVCFMDQPKQIRIIFHPTLHKQAVASNNMRHPQCCICLSIVPVIEFSLVNCVHCALYQRNSNRRPLVRCNHKVSLSYKAMQTPQQERKTKTTTVTEK